MKELNNWVCFRSEDRNGKKSKVPYDPKTGNRAKSNDPTTWSDYKTAATTKGYDGIGFMFSNSPYVGIDIDNCISGNGELSELALEVVQQLSSYTEYSPSGKGLHIICKADMPTGGNKNSRLGLEMYARGRFFTVTERIYGGYDTIEERKTEVIALWEKYFKKRNPTPTVDEYEPTSILNDDELLAKAVQSKNGEKFAKLYHGEWEGLYPSQSEAEQALCNILAFWTRKDRKQMDRLFRNSGLMRQKWDRATGGKTYGEITILKAINDLKGNGYAPKDLFGEWLYTDAKERPLQHWENTEHLCNTMGIVFRYNELRKCVETESPDYKGLSFDGIVTKLQGVCTLKGYKISPNILAAHIGLIAEHNSYNPVRDYLKECLQKWDKNDHIDELFHLWELDPLSDQNPAFCKILLTKWLVSAVKIAFNDGTTAAQGVLVIKGPQGIGKTRWLYKILPKKEWGKTGLMVDVKNKDTIMQALSFWITELGEYGRNISAEKSDHYKAFITDATDKFRAPYARTAQEHPRSTVFYATTDAESFLKDDAGERRNWVISVKSIGSEKIDIAQLWGHAAHLALVEKYPHWLQKDEITNLNCINEVYKTRSAEYEQIHDALNWDAPKVAWICLTPLEVCRAIGIPPQRVRLVGQALNQMSAKGVMKQRTARARKYVIPPFKDMWIMSWVKENVPNYKNSDVLDKVLTLKGQGENCIIKGK